MSTPGPLSVDQLRYMAQRHPDELAYRDLDVAAGITFAEWDAESNRLARGLVAHGIRRGDRVAVYLPSEHCLRWVVAYAAVHKAGAVAVPANTRLSGPEVVTVLGHAEVAAVVTCAALLDHVRAVRAAVPVLQTVISIDSDDDAVPWTEALDTDASPFQVPVDKNDLADIMYTSGTTGLPKGVAVRHRNIAMIPNNEPAWTGGGWLHGAPLFTFAGLACVFNPMKMGLTALYLPRFDAGRWMQIVEREKPVMTLIVPAMAELIVAHPDFGHYDLSSLVMVSIGSAPVAPKTLVTLQERLPGATVANSYGMSEAGPAFIVMPKEEVTNRIGSVGRPVPPMEAKIVDEQGDELVAGEVGELLTRLPGRQREYYRDEAATAQTWTDDGWLRTGDLGYFDDDGFLYLVGRKKDVIIRGGNNVYATDVEAVVIEHPAVREVAVVGMPHPVLGEDVAAFVVVKEGVSVTVDELGAFCAARLADYKRPRQVHFVGALPRNATGKVMKHFLRHPEAP